MNSKTSIIALGGSLRDQSHTRTCLRRALQYARDVGATTTHIDARDLNIPAFHPERQVGGGVGSLRQQVQNADTVLLGTPMYHGSFSSILKRQLDYCGFDEFEGKTVGLLAVSGGRFPTPALQQLRTVCEALNAWVIPHQVAVPNASAVIEDGEITDDEIDERIATLGRRAVEYAGVGSDPMSFASDGNIEAGD